MLCLAMMYPICREVNTEVFPNWGSKGFQGSRRFDSLKLWTTELYLGDDGFAEITENVFERVPSWKSLLHENENFEFAHRPGLHILCFRYKPKEFNEEEAISLFTGFRRRLWYPARAISHRPLLETTDS